MEHDDMDEDEFESVEAQLAKQGLRLADAGAGEPGWYVTVTDHDDDGTYGRKVWATDLPVEDMDEGDFADLDETDEDEFDGMGDHMCPQCGAHPGEECDCIVDDEPQEVKLTPNVVKEGFTFDKFMDRTLLTEHGRMKTNATKVSPQRQVARCYQEHPLGKIRMNGVRRG